MVVNSTHSCTSTLTPQRTNKTPPHSVQRHAQLAVNSYELQCCVPTALLLCCRELTYPDPRGILRLTFIVLAASAVLTALVWSIDRVFAALLFPPVAQRLSQGASLRGS